MIEIIRGNTLVRHIEILDPNGERYYAAEGDKAVFTVKASDSPDAPALIRKVLTQENLSEDGLYVLRLETEDTAGIAKGDYLFDLAVLIGGSDLFTVIPADIFRVLPALGDKEGFGN